MRIPHEWINDYVANRLDPAATADALTMLGLEVEEMEETGASGSAVLNIKVMSNRGDCLSMVGVARELAAEQDLPLSLPPYDMVAEGEPASECTSVIIEDEDLCYRYVAAVIKGLKVGPSPDWVAARLEAAGMRPINNIVDATNYVMLETGQPLHAFDYDLLEQNRIVVRRAKPGEKIRTIDGGERELSPDMLAICDASRPVAVAGVMGGYDSEVTDRTINVLLESACFNGSSIRATARQLNVPTEASYRFERGVDLAMTADVARRAAELMRTLAGGVICEGLVDASARVAQERRLEVRASRVHKVLGIQIPLVDCVSYLNRLGLESRALDEDTVSVLVPSRRADLTEEIDLIEEIGRIYGFNNLPATLISGESLQGGESPNGRFEMQLRRALVAAGLQEVFTPSIVAADSPREQGREPVKLRNSLSAEVAELRASLIPGLAQAIANNGRRGTRDFCCFEIGHVFSSGGGYREAGSVAVALTGARWDGDWLFTDRKSSAEPFRRALAADFYQAKGVAESLLRSCGVQEAEFAPVESALLRKGHSAAITVSGRQIGVVGEVSEELAQRYDLRTAVFAFEMDQQALAEVSSQQKRWKASSRFPSLKRDIAVVVAEKVRYADLEQTIRRVAGPDLESVEVLDIYHGQPLEDNQKSVALSIILRSSTKTYTDEEVSAIIGAVKEALRSDWEADFRA